MKSRNMIFSVLICLLLIGPTILFCTHAVAKIPMPGWLTSEDAKYLSGGSGGGEGVRAKVQSKIENSIPFKASVLLGNAALQRSFIEVSNAPFGWECYPTYYGSGYAYVPEYDALSFIPSRDSNGWLGKIREFSSKLSEFAEAHSDIEFYIIVPDMLRTSRINPVKALTSQTVCNEDLIEIMEDECGLANNVIVSGKDVLIFR